MAKRLITYVGWGIVMTASLYYIYTRAFNYFSFNKEVYGITLWPFAPWLLTHIVAGMMALLLGPLQFMTAIRKKYPAVHRLSGKIYLCSVLLAASVSLYISINIKIINKANIINGTGLVGLALAWLLTSGMAYWAVRRKDFQQHREWMIRSFVVTCAFTTIRFTQKILAEQFGVDPQLAYDLLNWAGWAVPLLVTEAFLQGSKINGRNLSLANEMSRANS